MAQNTKAYLAFKTEAERLTNLVALFSHAVPVLTRVMSSPQASALISLKPADNFPNDKATSSLLLKWSIDYSQDLARIIVLSVFSTFEVYIRAVLLEVYERQGGVEGFISLAENRSTRYWNSKSHAIIEAKRKLQTIDKKRNVDRYRKYSKILIDVGFPFPTELLAVYGARKLADKLQPKGQKAFRAWEIPEILSQALLFKVTSTETLMYEDLRELRNKVGHGSATALTVHMAIKKTSALRKWASRIDAHITDHFLVLTKYARHK